MPDTTAPARIAGFIIPLLVSAALAGPACGAQPVKLIDTDGFVPTAPGERFEDFLEPALLGGQVLVYAMGDAAEPTRGVYNLDGRGVGVVADTTMIAPGFGVPFTNFAPSGHSVGDDGVAIVWGEGAGLTGGIYLWSPGNDLLKLIDAEDVVEGGPVLTLGRPSRQGGHNAFLASNFEVSGVFTDVFGEVDNVAAKTDPVPGNPGGTWLSFDRPRLSGSNVAFKAGSFGGLLGFQRGFYAVHAGQLKKIADAGTPLPGEEDVFFKVNTFLRTSIAIEGTIVAFVSDSTASGFGGVYRLDLAGGAIEVIADAESIAPGSGGLTFAQAAPGGFGFEVAMHDGVVVFDTDEGVYAAGPDGLRRLIGVEDLDAGVNYTDLEVGPDSFDGASIAFVARAEGGYRSVWRAPVPAGCAEDLSGDGSIDSGDLNDLLGAFGASDAGDIDGDGDTDSGDLNRVLALFGAACP